MEGKLRHREWSGDWLTGPSLQHIMARRARACDLDLPSMLAPTRAWFDDLARAARNGSTVPGDRLDSIWRNCWVVDGSVRYIDQEWEWTEPLPFSLVLTRGLYHFAYSLLDAPSLSPLIRRWRVDHFIVDAAACYGVALDKVALNELVRFEAALLAQVAGDPGYGETNVARILRRRLNPSGAQILGGLPRRGFARLKRRWRAWAAAIATRRPR